MHLDLDRLCREAQQLVVPASHGQRPEDHEWVAAGGGRACPRGGNNSQALYECSLCGEVDYGDPPGPGFTDCFSSPEGCAGCLPLEEQCELPPSAHWDPMVEYRRASFSQPNHHKE